MLFWILLAVVVIVAATVVIRNTLEWWFDWGVLAFTAIVSVVVMLFGTALLSMGAWSDLKDSSAEQRVVETKTYELQAITNGEDQRGKASAFFLVAAGSWDTEQVFKYLYKDTNGAFRLDKIDAEDAFIYEKDNVNPQVVQTERESYDDSRFWVPWEVTRPWGLHTEFTVPVGSVLNQYDVGLD